MNPEKETRKLLDEMAGIGGIPSALDFYEEFTFRLRERLVNLEQRQEANQHDTVVSVAGLKELDWKLIGEGDYAAEHGEYFARIEELDRACIWFQLYKDGTEMFIEDNYVQSLEQAERAIIKAINESSH